jgi:hypothetical protein
MQRKQLTKPLKMDFDVGRCSLSLEQEEVEVDEVLDGEMSEYGIRDLLDWNMQKENSSQSTMKLTLI